VVFDKKTLGFEIQHKFGTLENGIPILGYLWSLGTNIRLALGICTCKKPANWSGHNQRKNDTPISMPNTAFCNKPAIIKCL
jgi:hypothetical protein